MDILVPGSKASMGCVGKGGVTSTAIFKLLVSIMSIDITGGEIVMLSGMLQQIGE